MSTIKDKQDRLTQAELDQFMGGDERYAHPLNRRVLYTPGVRHLATAGQAFWLIDAIASYLTPHCLTPLIKKDPRIESMSFWKLIVLPDKSATLTARADSNVMPFVIQEIPYTDFPLDSVDVWAAFDGAFWTLYLPSEH